MNVLKSRIFAVKLIFAFARTVIAACNGNLVAVAYKGTVSVIKAKRNLGKADCTACRCTAEYNVLHLGAAKTFCGLLAENPAHSVRDVTLSASVRAYNGCYAFSESQNSFVGERLKALQFNRF